ncbi:MAG: hypothetical protein AAFV80_17600 [Bacteroidota bacterium]
MKPYVLVIICCLFVASTSFAQSYAITYSANQVYTDVTPVTKKVEGNTTLEFSIDGSDVTVTMGDSGKGLWSAHIMRGQTGNNKFVATLTNGDKSVYTIRGTFRGEKVTGNFIYFRHGSRPTIVPGWTAVRFEGSIQ